MAWDYGGHDFHVTYDPASGQAKEIKRGVRRISEAFSLTTVYFPIPFAPSLVLCHPARKLSFYSVTTEAEQCPIWLSRSQAFPFLFIVANFCRRSLILLIPPRSKIPRQNRHILPSRYSRGCSSSILALSLRWAVLLLSS